MIRMLATASLLLVAVAGCGGGGGDDASDIPDPKPEWIRRLKENPNGNLSDDPVVTYYSYSAPLVDKLVDCGAGRNELEQLQAAIPTPPLRGSVQSPFLTFGASPNFLFQLEGINEYVYEVTSCKKVKSN